MKLRDHPYVLMTMVLASIVAGGALAMVHLQPLPWRTVIIAAVGGGIVIGVVAGLARRRWQDRRS